MFPGHFFGVLLLNLSRVLPPPIRISQAANSMEASKIGSGLNAFMKYLLCVGSADRYDLQSENEGPVRLKLRSIWVPIQTVQAFEDNPKGLCLRGAPFYMGY